MILPCSTAEDGGSEHCGFENGAARFLVPFGRGVTALLEKRGILHNHALVDPWQIMVGLGLWFALGSGLGQGLGQGLGFESARASARASVADLHDLQFATLTLTLNP